MDMSNYKLKFESEAMPHLDDLYSVALWMLGDNDEAEDLVRKSYIEAFESWTDPRALHSPRIHLFKALAKNYIKVHRSRYELPREFGANTSFGSNSPYEHLDSRTAGNYMDEIFREITCNDIKGVLLELPQTIKLIIILSRIMGFTNQECAEITGLGKGIIELRLYQGCKLLKMELLKLAENKNNSRAEVIRK